MSTQPDLRLLTLAGIAHRCSQETDRFFQRLANDSRFCFELFRRAIQERSQRAWDLVYRQYRLLVAGWVQRHPAFPGCGEESQFLVNRAFEKMWQALTPDRFLQVPDLKSLLRYLQMIVHSVVVDQVRLCGAPTDELPADESAAMAGPPDLALESESLDPADRCRFWDAVSRRLHDDKERRVVLGSFVLALKPREILAEYPGTFSGIEEIYRVKENVLDRLRRDLELRKMLGLDA